jgi:hypothetical protein
MQQTIGDVGDSGAFGSHRDREPNEAIRNRRAAALPHFSITVFGQIDVEASDGTRAHLRTGDMCFIEDVTGKGHRTFEEGSQSVFLRVPENFDVKKWAAGN